MGREGGAKGGRKTKAPTFPTSVAKELDSTARVVVGFTVLWEREDLLGKRFARLFV